MSKTQLEPLLCENPNRFVMFPLKDMSCGKCIKK